MTSPRTIDVLVVEDDSGIRDALEAILTDQGYELATAANGAEALAHIDREGAPKLVVLDLMMPVMDGWTFHRELLHRPDGDRVSVVVLSGFPLPSGAEMARGIQYVAKPIKMETLLHLVAGELSRLQNQSARPLAAGTV